MDSSSGIIIIGAGPAGGLAAGAAAAGGARVTVLDRLPRPGLKLLASGGGRCNVTNALEPEAFLARFEREPARFMRPALLAFPGDALREWLARRGVPLHAADGFHYFPVSEAAVSVLDALLAECRKQKVQLLTNSPVAEILTSGGRACGVRLADGTALPARSVILAAGGCSYPGLGSDGSGFALARRAGLELRPPLPALAPLLTAETWPGRCAGITLPAAEVRIALPDCRKQVWRGPLLFTHRGVSGPTVLDASGEVAARLAAGAVTVPLRLNLFPDITPEAWRQRLDGWRRSQGAKLARNLVAESAPGRLGEALAELAELGETRAARLSREQSERIVAGFTELPVHATATEGGFVKAMATRGGVRLGELSSRTLECRKLPGLFCAGEVLDVDGPCGGFNLTWAFASGYFSGAAAAAEK